MNNKLFESIKEQLVGSSLKTDGFVTDNINFVNQLKSEADSYEWLYHCTNSTAFLSILNNQEFWLTNIKCVNDKEEAERIDVEEYENSYYVACFTYENNISQEHCYENKGSVVH